MEKIHILSVDPSLRNTGMVLLTYNAEFLPSESKAYSVNFAQVLVNPQKFTGTDAILSMIDMISDEAKKDFYSDLPEIVLVESPPIMFNKTWSGGTIASIAHISGACVALFGVEKCYLFRPNEWNKARKKEATHHQTIGLLGDPDTWNYARPLKNEKLREHILDAASMALYWVKSNYLEE